MGMKKINVFGLLLAVCLASCSVNDVKPDVAEPELGSRLVTLYANAGEMTKTDYAGDVTFSWVAGDKISVLYHNSLDEPVWVEFVASTSAASSAFTATVAGDLTIGAPTTGTQWALYPANASHVYTDDSTIGFALPTVVDGNTAKIPMIATLASGASGPYHFRQLGGALKLTIKNIRSEVSKIRLYFNTETDDTKKYLSGVYAIQSPGSSTPSIEHNAVTSDGEHFISATADVNPTTHVATVYMPLPNNLAAWPFYVFAVYDADNDVQLFYKKIGTGGAITSTRRQINVASDLTLADIDRSSLIQVDGYFDEWGTAAGVVSKTWPGTSSQPFDLKVASDGTNIWFYHRLDGSKVNLSYSGYIELFIDRDNDASSGDTGKWFAKGTDKDLVYYYSNSDGSIKNSFSFVRWENWTYNDGTDSWSWVSGGASPTVSWAGHKDPSTNDMTFEWGVPIADLGITAGSTVRFGFVVRKPEATSNNDLLSITIPTPGL